MLKVKAMNGGAQSGVALVESADKVFLFAEKEYYGAVKYSSATEGSALNQLDYYANNNVSLSTWRVEAMYEIKLTCGICGGDITSIYLLDL